MHIRCSTLFGATALVAALAASSTTRHAQRSASETPREEADGTRDDAPPSDSAGIQTLDTVTVVGTVADLQSLDFYAPNSSFVLRREDIEAQGARKLDQALHYQAGVL